MIRKEFQKPKYPLDDLSFMEKVICIMIPVVLTWMDYMILTGMFNFKWWVTLSIASVSTVCIIWLISVLVTYILDRN